MHSAVSLSTFLPFSLSLACFGSLPRHTAFLDYNNAPTSTSAEACGIGQASRALPSLVPLHSAFRSLPLIPGRRAPIVDISYKKPVFISALPWLSIISSSVHLILYCNPRRRRIVLPPPFPPSPPPLPPSPPCSSEACGNWHKSLLVTPVQHGGKARSRVYTTARGEHCGLSFYNAIRGKDLPSADGVDGRVGGMQSLGERQTDKWRERETENEREKDR